MVEIGIVEIIGMAGALGIIGSMFIVLYNSRKQAKGFKLDIETKVLNDLDEKVRKMAEIIIEKPGLLKLRNLIIEKIKAITGKNQFPTFETNPLLQLSFTAPGPIDS